MGNIPTIPVKNIQSKYPEVYGILPSEENKIVLSNVDDKTVEDIDFQPDTKK